jgi:hypothetical protein
MTGNDGQQSAVVYVCLENQTEIDSCRLLEDLFSSEK